MGRILTPHPHRHPIDPWTLYAHAHATSNTYTEAFTRVARMESLEEWAAVWNHCHPDVVGDPRRAVLVRGNRVLSWSLFRDDIRPTWEDPANEGGFTITHRTNVHEMDARRAWDDLVRECIRGAFPSWVIGVQVTQKPSRHTTFVKFDVWLAAGVDLLCAQRWLKMATRLDFTPSPRQSSSAPPPATSSHVEDVRRARVARSESRSSSHRFPPTPLSVRRGGGGGGTARF